MASNSDEAEELYVSSLVSMVRRRSVQYAARIGLTQANLLQLHLLLIGCSYVLIC
jgi:hypothetical protein